MAKWKYTGDDERDFPFSPVGRVRPGDIVEADDNPDPAFFKPSRRQAAVDEKE